MSSSIPIKICYQNDTRRISMDPSTTYVDLHQNIAQLYRIPDDDRKNLEVYYKDDEGDTVIISSDLELKEAIYLMGHTPQQTLRLTLKLKSMTKPTLPPRPSCVPLGYNLPNRILELLSTGSVEDLKKAHQILLEEVPHCPEYRYCRESIESLLANPKQWDYVQTLMASCMSSLQQMFNPHNIQTWQNQLNSFFVPPCTRQNTGVNPGSFGGSNPFPAPPFSPFTSSIPTPQPPQKPEVPNPIQNPPPSMNTSISTSEIFPMNLPTPPPRMSPVSPLPPPPQPLSFPLPPITPLQPVTPNPWISPVNLPPYPFPFASQTTAIPSIPPPLPFLSPIIPPTTPPMPNGHPLPNGLPNPYRPFIFPPPITPTSSSVPPPEPSQSNNEQIPITPAAVPRNVNPDPWGVNLFQNWFKTVIPNDIPEKSYPEEMKLLGEMGWNDRGLCLKALQQSKGDIMNAIEFLLANEASNISL